MLFCHECQRPYPHPANSWDCPFCAKKVESYEGIPLFSPALAFSCGGFPSDVHEELARQEVRFFWFAYRNALIEWALSTFLRPPRQLFDMGCGTGFFLEFISAKHPQVSCTGGEVYASALQTARSRVPGGEFYQVDAEHLPFFEEFDVVGAFDVLEHLDNDRKALAEIHRSLRPGGGVILTVPQHPSLWSETDEFACHKRRYTRQRLVRILEDTGYCVSFISSFMTLLLPAMATARIVRGLLGMRNSDPHAEMKVSDRLNDESIPEI